MRILDIVDSQVGFMLPQGDLYIKGAEKITPLMNDFFRKIPRFAYSFALAKYDTHIRETYHHSPESEDFPLHCQYQEPSWQLAVDVSLLPNDVFFMTKGTFDMWGETPAHINNNPNAIVQHYSRQGIELSKSSAVAIKNMNMVCRDKDCLKPLLSRDSFFHQVAHQIAEHYDNGNGDGDGSSNGSGLPLHNLEVHMVGVASDHCNRFAMEGYLARGATVVVLEDLTEGIELSTAEVLQEAKYKDYVATGQLSAVPSSQALEALHSTATTRTA